MSFPRYERYKSSGVEWLVEVPGHWEITKLKRVATKIGSGKTPRGGSEVYVSEGVIFLRSQNVHDTGLRLDDVVYISQEMDEEMDNTRVQAGDILLNVTGASIGRTSMVPISLGAANVSQHVCIIRIPDIDSRQFLAFALQGHSIKCQIELAQNGAAREGLNFEQIGNLVFALPSSAKERGAVINFLHGQLDQIDRLIEEQGRLIELLKEKRQAVISRTITQGLDSQSPMKSSGADWLGSVPSHWIVQRGGHSFIERDERSESGDEEMLTVSHLTGVTPRSEKTVNMFEAETTEGYKRVYPGDLVINTLWAWMGAMGVSSHDGIVSPAYHVYRPRPELLPEYVNALVRMSAFAKEASRWSKGVWSSRLRLYPQEMFRILFPVPPLDEQRQISERIRGQDEEMTELIQESELAITLLRERRITLISAAVTGKIDVSASVAKPVMSANLYSSGFAHQLLAAEILDRCNSQRMGRIKLQKLIHLCEYHGQVSEVQGDYSRKAAGPFDAKAMAGISKNLKKQKWFEEVKDGERYVYRPLEKRGEHKKYLSHWQAEMPRIDEVLSLLGNFKTRECEIVSTLYAAWNDLLIDGGLSNDGAILHEASSAERWHKSKEQIATERWKKALQWMKDKGLVPVGYGKHTRHTAGTIGTAIEVAHEPA